MRLIALSLLFLVLVFPLAHATEAGGDSRTWLKGFITQLGKVSSSVNETEAHALVEIYYDSSSILGRASIDFIDTLNSEQKKELTALFDKLLKKKFFSEMKNWEPYFKNYSIVSVTANNGLEKIKVQSVVNNHKTVVINFFVLKQEQNYKIVDLEVDGVLLSRNFRSQFNRIVNEEGFQGIVARLNQKLNQASL
ncbi:ABC transporter substrate-binding protein [bacterium]|nr:ABC transporter substrate-binding protein [bacterium]